MAKDVEVLLQHVLESIGLIHVYLQDLPREDFLQSTQIQDAVFRRLEIIGEAIKNIPEDFRKRHRSIPWREVAGLRDVLIHQYFAVDAELTWKMVKDELPLLEQAISEILKSMP